MKAQFALVLLAVVAVSGVAASTDKVLNTVSRSEGPIDDILTLLEEIKSNLKQERADAEALNVTQQKHCVDMVKQYKAEVDHQIEQKELATQAIADRNTRIQNNKDAIKVREDELETNAAHLKTKSADRQTNADLHSQKLEDHKAALECVQAIKDQLVASSLKGSGGTGDAADNTRVQRVYTASATSGEFVNADAENDLAAFLEVSVSSESMQQLLDLSDAQLMKESKGELRHTYQSALKALAEAKGAGQGEKVKKIIALLDKLSTALAESQSGFEAEEAKAIEAHTQLQSDIQDEETRLQGEISDLEDENIRLEKEIVKITEDFDAAEVAREEAQTLLDDKIGTCWTNEDSWMNLFHAFLRKNDQEMEDFGVIEDIVNEELSGMHDELKTRTSHVDENGTDGDKHEDYESLEAAHENKLKERESTEDWTDERATPGGVRNEITYEKEEFVDSF